MSCEMKANRSVTHADLPAAGMLGIHLTHVKGRKIDRMDDRKPSNVQLATRGAGVHQRQRRRRVGAVLGRSEVRMRERTWESRRPKSFR